jgi:hypothetical protein
MILQARGYGWAVCAGLAGAGLLLLITRGLIGHAPHYDELLHVLAARGLLESGQPVIDQGIYPLAELYSRSVAWSYRLFGDNLVAARAPALAAGVALVFVMGAWVTRRAGLLGGLATAVLLCVVPTTVDVAVFARMYTFHALIMVLMFIGLFEACEPGRSWAARLAMVAFSIALLPLGWHLQPTTIIAAGAGIAGVLALQLLDHWPRIQPIIRGRPVSTIGAVGLAGAVILVILWLSGLLDRLNEVPLWAAGNADRPHFYLVALGRDLPLLWPLLPLAATMAVASPAQRRLALYCVVVVASALVVHSIAAQKALRYIYYFLPLVCVLWACALAAVTALDGRPAQGMKGDGGARLAPFVVMALLAVGFAFSQEGVRILNLAAGRLAAIDGLPFADEPDWTQIVPDLEPAVRVADRVVASNSMKALYYLGRYDFELNATIVPETVTGLEFGTDWRTGRQVIGRAESIARVLEQPGDSLVVIETKKIGRFSGVTDEAFAVIESRCREMSLSAEVGVRAWTCAVAH